MDFGVFNLMGYRDPGTPTATVLAETVEQTRFADELGFGMSWFAEHHFSNYCVCPSPLLMAAHCAGVTKRIKLATGVLVLPLYQPSRLIAEIATVDALSGGRLVLGVGSGYQPYEFDRFGVDIANSKPMTEELIRMIELGLEQPVFEFDGEHYKQPKTHIGARCAGRRPEIWVAGEAPPIQRFTARNGHVPIVSGRTANAAALGAMRKRCEEAYAAEGIPPEAMPMAALRYACVTDSKDEARDYAENLRYQLRLAASLRNRGELQEGAMLLDPPYANEPSLEQVIDTLMIGDAETCAERAVAEIRSMRPVHIAMYFRVGNFPHSRAMRSMERFATEVVPLIERELGPLDRLAGTVLGEGGRVLASPVAA